MVSSAVIPEQMIDAKTFYRIVRDLFPSESCRGLNPKKFGIAPFATVEYRRVTPGRQYLLAFLKPELRPNERNYETYDYGTFERKRSYEFVPVEVEKLDWGWMFFRPLCDITVVDSSGDFVDQYETGRLSMVCEYDCLWCVPLGFRSASDGYKLDCPGLSPITIDHEIREGDPWVLSRQLTGQLHKLPQPPRLS